MERLRQVAARVRRFGLQTLGACGIALGSATVAAAPPPDDASTAETAETAPASETQESATEAPSPTSAGDWYTRGIELGNAGEFSAAAEAFLRSYELQPTLEALFNAALALDSAGDNIAAIAIYRRFLAEPDLDPTLAHAAADAVTRLLREVGTLKGVRYDPEHPPAELYINGARHELDELPILLQPGPVVIEVVDDDGERGQETYEMAAGEVLVIDIRALLARKPEPVVIGSGPTAAELEAERAEQEAARARARRAKQLRTLTWVGVGLTGAATISSVALLGVAARERRAYFDATCLEFPNGTCPNDFVPDDADLHLRSYERARVGLIVSASVAGGLAIGTLVVGLLSRRLDRQGSRGAARARRVRLAPSLDGFVLEF